MEKFAISAIPEASHASAVIVRRKNPTLAGALSALVCGLGQVYSGHEKRGVMLFFIFGILLALAGAVWIFGIFDAFTGCRGNSAPR